MSVERISPTYVRVELGSQNSVSVHLTLVPYIRAAGEFMTKPTQHSVQKLREIGVQCDSHRGREYREREGEERNRDGQSELEYPVERPLVGIGKPPEARCRLF